MSWWFMLFHTRTVGKVNFAHFLLLCSYTPTPLVTYLNYIICHHCPCSYCTKASLTTHLMWALTTLFNQIGSQGRKDNCVRSPTAALPAGVLLFWQWVNTLSSQPTRCPTSCGKSTEEGEEKKRSKTFMSAQTNGDCQLAGKQPLQSALHVSTSHRSD